MRIHQATLETCHEADGAVVVIDVLRAFTTACFAFRGGAFDILLASTVDEAFDLRRRFPGSLIVGEVDGYPVEGFDFGNSPSLLRKSDLRGIRVIQRTTAGSQGATRSVKAKRLLGCCLCNLSATASALKHGAEDHITLLTTGVFAGGWGDEDVACAESLRALLEGQRPDLARTAERVRNSRSGLHYRDPSSTAFPPEDLAMALAVDSYPMPLEIHRQDKLLLMRPGEPPGSPTTYWRLPA